MVLLSKKNCQKYDFQLQILGACALFSGTSACHKFAFSMLTDVLISWTLQVTLYSKALLLVMPFKGDHISMLQTWDS